MGLLNIASGSSKWRGLDYYRNKKVKKYKKINENEYEYEGIVLGSNGENYNVFLDLEHPRSSKCNCLHAKDRRIICKHIIALYFTIFPEKADKFLKEAEESEKEYEQYEEVLYNRTIKYIKSMNKNDLVNALIETLDIAPDWVYDRFTRDYNLL